MFVYSMTAQALVQTDWGMGTKKGRAKAKKWTERHLGNIAAGNFVESQTKATANIEC